MTNIQQRTMIVDSLREFWKAQGGQFISAKPKTGFVGGTINLGGVGVGIKTTTDYVIAFVAKDDNGLWTAEDIRDSVIKAGVSADDIACDDVAGVYVIATAMAPNDEEDVACSNFNLDAGTLGELGIELEDYQIEMLKNFVLKVGEVFQDGVFNIDPN